MARSVYVKNNTLGTLKLADGTGSPVELTCDYDSGDVSVSEIRDTLNTVNPVSRRGRFIGATHGERLYPQITFTAKFLGFTGSPIEFIGRKGDYSGNVSTLGSGAALPYTTDCTLTIEGTDQGDPVDETIVATDVSWTAEFAEADDADTISFTGVVFGKLTINGTDYTEVS